ncbi:MAG: GGDEF domain-containing protein, partial [Desulfuromonadales bacterium]|nr:GGDEF domain-containing protein [Desulfuromonadales bacterium]
VARYGGEEFALLLPEANRQQAFKIAERIRAAIEQTHFPSQELLDSGNLTVSGGLAIYPQDAQTTDGLIGRADAELYLAKARRNTIYPTHKERRRSCRRRVRSIIEISIDQGKSFQPGLSADASRLGLTIGTAIPLEPGSLVRLRLSPPFWPKKQQLLAIVRHVRREPKSGIIYAGMEFDGSAEELDHLRRDDSTSDFSFSFPALPPL